VGVRGWGDNKRAMCVTDGEEEKSDGDIWCH
jgi:hypothetical protein